MAARIATKKLDEIADTYHVDLHGDLEPLIKVAMTSLGSKM